MTLPRFFGITGVYASMPVADACAIILSAVVMWREIRTLNRMSGAAAR
jgi:Na+-driven multidrug efflux pump